MLSIKLNLLILLALLIVIDVAANDDSICDYTDGFVWNVQYQKARISKKKFYLQIQTGEMCDYTSKTMAPGGWSTLKAILYRAEKYNKLEL